MTRLLWICAVLAVCVLYTASSGDSTSDDEQIVYCHTLVKEWDTRNNIESDGEYNAPQIPQSEEPHITVNHTPPLEDFAFPEGSDWGPFKVRIQESTKSTNDIAVYASLAQMFRGLLLNSTIRKMDWYQFIQNAIETNNASIQTLCDRYSRFICENGEITVIRFNSLGLQGIFNVSSVPDSVRSLTLHRNSLTGISGLDALGGKKLHYLNVMQNPLNIDLKPLERSSKNKGNPLRILSATNSQLSKYFIGIDHDQFHVTKQGSWRVEAIRVDRAVRKWIDNSILERIFIRALNGHRNRKVQSSKECWIHE